MAEKNLTGASFHKSSGRWLSRIRLQGTNKTTELGYFETQEKACLAYDYARQYFGFEKVNFPDRETPEAVIRAVRPKLVAIRKVTKFNVGASFHTASRRWRARIRLNRMVELGYFENQESAFLAYDYACEYFGRPKVNFPDRKTPEAIIRAVRPKLVEIRKAQRLENDVIAVSDEYWHMGYTPGVQWAQGTQRVPIDLDGLACDWSDPVSIMDALGIVELFADYTDPECNHFEFKGRTLVAKKLAWIRGFLRGAKDEWARPKSKQTETGYGPVKELTIADIQAAARLRNAKLAEKPGEQEKPSVKEWETPEYKARIIEVAARQKERERLLAEDPKSFDPDDVEENFTTDGEFIFGMPHKDGSIYSPLCNPRTLERDNAAIHNDAVNRTGFFQMLDEDIAKRKQQKQPELDLSAIL
jgi:AP2 domain